MQVSASSHACSAALYKCAFDVAWPGWLGYRIRKPPVREKVHPSWKRMHMMVSCTIGPGCCVLAVLHCAGVWTHPPLQRTGPCRDEWLHGEAI